MEKEILELKKEMTTLRSEVISLKKDVMVLKEVVRVNQNYTDSKIVGLESELAEH